jgi:hypothetical protein
MLAIADPNKENTANMLASLPSRTGEQPDNIQVEHGNLQVGQGQQPFNIQVEHGNLQVEQDSSKTPSR